MRPKLFARSLGVRPRPCRGWRRLVAVGLLAGAAGCTSLQDYVHNGFKVGPNYGRPPAPVAQQWIDANDQRLRTETDDLSQWWKVFSDPVLDDLVGRAYRQNLSLREAGFQVLRARAELGIAVGEIFPQAQDLTGSYRRIGTSNETVGRSASSTLHRFFGQWDLNFNVAWELDFWGRFRRAIESAEATLDASVENYDDVLVTLLGDVATRYVLARTFEQRIKLARANVDLQRRTLEIAQARFKGGTATELDVDQARSNLAQTEALIPQLETSLRQATNQLSILLGLPPEELSARWGAAGIPAAPTEVAAGIPADLLRRRPDVRRAERQAAAQSAQIGIAESDLYPHFTLNGSFGYSAEHLNKLFRPSAFEGSFGPAFRWDILNYGRLWNNVRAQSAAFQQLVAAYQNTVLVAAREVEDGLIAFLKNQERAKTLAESVDASEKAVNIAIAQYRNGTIDFNRLALLQQNLVQQQDLLAQARGDVALGLIQVYRALGGGWQIRLAENPTCGPAESPPTSTQ